MYFFKLCFKTLKTINYLKKIILLAHLPYIKQLCNVSCKSIRHLSSNWSYAVKFGKWCNHLPTGTVQSLTFSTFNKSWICKLKKKCKMSPVLPQMYHCSALSTVLVTFRLVWNPSLWSRWKRKWAMRRSFGTAKNKIQHAAVMGWRDGDNGKPARIRRWQSIPIRYVWNKFIDWLKRWRPR